MKTDFSVLKREVVDQDLCTHCGTCVGICPAGCLEIKNSEKGPIPHLVGKCETCSLCVEICPGKYVDFGELNKSIFRKEADPYLGFYEKIFVGHARDKTIRISGSSGGVVTQILISMLKKELITKAIVLGFSKEEPWKTEAKIVSMPEEIVSTSQSKYVIYPLNAVLKEIKDKKDKYAIVALPCQVHALRKLQHSHLKDSFQSIKFIIGLYCGNNLFFSATLALLKKLGVYDFSQIKKISYREGTWPGRFEVVLENGEKRGISKVGFNYLTFLYTPKRCLYCIDLTNEFADVSVGDAWGYPDSSVIICRNRELLEFIIEMYEQGDIEIKEISSQEAILMHSHGLDNKKKGAWARIKIVGSKGKSVPDYGEIKIDVDKRRIQLERILLFIFRIGENKMIQKLVNCIPVSFLEKIMSVVRERWRRSTKGIN